MTSITPRVERDTKVLRVSPDTLTTLLRARYVRDEALHNDTEAWAFNEMMFTPGGAGLIPADALVVLIQMLVDERAQADEQTMPLWRAAITTALDECQRKYAEHVRTAANVAPARAGCLSAAVLLVIGGLFGLVIGLIATGRL